ncbi:MAG: DsbA family protein [Methylobacteriaceae bacterium]|nr:DsbA family protein [Methylobacteriaceae bacterium]
MQAAVLEIHGPRKAYALHRRLLAAPGPVDEAPALAAARDLQLDTDRIKIAMSGAAVGSHIKRQKQIATDLGLRYTPTFAIGNTAFIGWPGIDAMKTFIANARRCGAPRCGTG